jgi:hypothetical protein
MPEFQYITTPQLVAIVCFLAYIDFLTSLGHFMFFASAQSVSSNTPDDKGEAAGYQPKIPT